MAINPYRRRKGTELGSGHNLEPSAALLCWVDARALAQGSESCGGSSWGNLPQPLAMLLGTLLW